MNDRDTHRPTAAATTTAATTVDPATGSTLATYDLVSGDGVDAVLRRAHTAFGDWREVAVTERARRVGALAHRLRDGANHLAALLTAEMGKPIAASRAEVEKCAAAAEWVAATAAAELAAQPLPDDDGDAFVRQDPLGVLLAVMPWNFPLWQSLRFALPNLAAGNVVVVKPAPVTVGSALALQEVLAPGLPDGTLQTVLFDTDAIADVIADDRVAGVTLTGSDRAGRAVAAQAGQYLKKAVLELGGSDPFLVLPDADVEAAARVAVASRMQNCGQSCIAAKRFIVHADVADAFTAAMVAQVRQLTVGDPTAEGTDVGPLATAKAREQLHAQVKAALADGAHAAIGGRPVAGPGAFYEPTVLTGVTADSPVAVEEVFGPVAAVMVAADLDEMVELANATRFGLGATVFTGDVDAAHGVVVRLDAGQVFVNSMVRSDPRFPFGGVKQSGYGRELGPQGYREFVNAKLVRIDRPATRTARP